MSRTQHTTHNPDPDAIETRDVNRDDAFFTVNLPLSSTQTARDDKAFTEERLRGFARQIERRQIPVFLSHGRSDLSEGRYGALGKIGRVASPELDTREGVTRLVADLEIADPDAIAEEGDAGDVEEALRWVRQQSKLGLLTTSVGWNEELGDRDVPGDAELLECSIVGIPSDTQAQQSHNAPSEAVVRGFEEIAEHDETPPRDPLNRDFWTADEPTDAERVADALEALGHLAEFHRPEGRAFREHETPAVVETIDTVRDEFDGADPEAVLEDLWEGRSFRRDRREIVLERLAEIEADVDTLARPRTRSDYITGQVRQYPFGRSPEESAEAITDAVEAIRDALTEDTEVEGFGLRAVTEAR